MPDNHPRLAHIRAALLLVVCLVSVCGALPLPAANLPRLLRDPAGQQELARWERLLDRVGLGADTEALAALTGTLAVRVRDLRRGLLSPVQPLWRITASQQGWPLFGFPNTHPYALEVARDDGDGWRPLYRSGDPALDWHAGWLQYRRVRALYNPSLRPPSTYDGFVDHVAARIFAEDPGASVVRVRFLRQEVPRPGVAGPLDPPRQRFLRKRMRADP